MGKSSRKMKRHEAAPVGSYRYDKACNRIAEQAIYQVLALAIDILWNDFGGLQRRSTRLNFLLIIFASAWRKSTKVLLLPNRPPWTSSSGRLAIA